MSFKTCTLYKILLGRLIKDMILAEHVACKGQMRNVFKILVRIPELKKPLVRFWHRRVDKIKIYLTRGPVDCNPPIWLQFFSVAVDPPLTSRPKYSLSTLHCFSVIHNFIFHFNTLTL
jgi:hypothetical protein